MGNLLDKNQLKNKMSTPEEQAIQGVIDQIWETLMSIRVENSIRKRPRSSFRTLSETSDQETSSLQRLLMKSSAPSTRTTQAQLRRARWLFSSSNSSVDNEHEPST